MNLSIEHIQILSHTKNRAANRQYAGNSQEMQELVDAGLMEYVGTVGFCPDKIFTITDEGLKVLKKIKAAAG